MKRKSTTPLKKVRSTKYRKYRNQVLLTRPAKVERKWRHVGYLNVKPAVGSLYAVNPFYYMTNSVNQDGRIGLNLSNVVLYVRAKFTHWGTNSVGTGIYSTSRYRVLVVASPNEWNQGASETTPVTLGAGTGNNLLGSDLLMDTGIDRVTTSFTNKDTFKILHDSGPITVDSCAIANNNNNGFTREYRCTVKCGDLRFKYNGSSYLRDDNIYIVIASDVMGFNAPSVSDIPGVWSMNVLSTFQDS